MEIKSSPSHSQDTKFLGMSHGEFVEFLGITCWNSLKTSNTISVFLIKSSSQ